MSEIWKKDALRGSYVAGCCSSVVLIVVSSPVILSYGKVRTDFCRIDGFVVRSDGVKVRVVELSREGSCEFLISVENSLPARSRNISQIASFIL
jgi:hypothetical protein